MKYSWWTFVIGALLATHLSCKSRSQNTSVKAHGAPSDSWQNPSDHSFWLKPGHSLLNYKDAEETCQLQDARIPTQSELLQAIDSGLLADDHWYIEVDLGSRQERGNMLALPGISRGGVYGAWTARQNEQSTKTIQITFYDQRPQNGQDWPRSSREFKSRNVVDLTRHGIAFCILGRGTPPVQPQPEPQPLPQPEPQPLPQPEPQPRPPSTRTYSCSATCEVRYTSVDDIGRTVAEHTETPTVSSRVRAATGQEAATNVRIELTNQCRRKCHGWRYHNGGQHQESRHRCVISTPTCG